ncbi:MAG: hypothetical protein ABJK25_15170 [Halieaceae bacterium]
MNLYTLSDGRPGPCLNMYEEIDEFRDDALACGVDYYSDGSLDDDKLEAAYRIYQKASHGTRLKDFDGHSADFGLTIVGRLARRSSDGSWQCSNEDFPSIDEIMRENLTVMDEGAEGAGTVLDADLWSLLANDAWLLGGIHALTEFHFASPLRHENMWDTADNRMTVTGREVLGIATAGYKIERPVEWMEAVALCIDAAKVSAFSLKSYKNAVESCSSIQGFERFYSQIPVSAR